MSLTRTFQGKHPETGEPYYHYHQDDPSKPVVLTGPATGTLVLADGTAYNVSEDVIETATLEHAHEVADLIGAQHEQTGRFDAVHPETGEPVPFKYTGHSN